MFAILVIAVACKKIQEENQPLNKPSNNFLKELSNKPKLKFTWAPFQVQSCQGGECGVCPGICIIFRGVIADTITQQEIEEWYSFVDLELTSDTTLTLAPLNNSMDNGDSTVNVTSDFD
jgi:hypothetical protein